MLRALDLAVLRALREHGHPPMAERSVLVFTRWGEHGLLWQLICLVGALGGSGKRNVYLRSSLTVGIAYLSNIALKYAIRRTRPRLPDLPALSSTVTTLSFPSAHATTSFAAARSLSSTVPPAPLYLAASAMAASRVYVGVHYPSDVLAGAAFGTAIATLLGPPPGR